MGDTVILGRIPDVELMQAGTWAISTGVVTFTPEDLAAAVEAQACPAVRRPVLKLGHVDPRFDGEPAVGWVGAMRVPEDNPFTLVGDYEGMPEWLADAAPSAYPDRSIEGQYGFQCQIGHTHPFVVTAVALLGVTPPGVGTLDSLQDVAALYGVAASGESAGTPVRVVMKGSRMPEPVAAAVTVEDVRREFYEGAPWSMWIAEVSLNPLQIIACDDEDGTYVRIPFEVDAADKLTFGAPVKVTRTYVDAPAEAADETPVEGLAMLNASRVVYASREQSRPTQVPAAAVVDGSQRGAGMDPAKLRDALGLTADASDVEVQAALAASGITTAAATDTPAPPTATLPEGVVAIDAETLEGLQVAASRGVEAHTRLETQDRDSTIRAAIAAGKIAPARREHYELAWQSDAEGTKQVLAALAPGLVPVAATGYAGDGETVGDLDAEYAALFPSSKES